MGLIKQDTLEDQEVVEDKVETYLAFVKENTEKHRIVKEPPSWN